MTAAYKEVFLDSKHNHQRLLMDDCLRCHGTHYDGSIRELVPPSIRKGRGNFAMPLLPTGPSSCA